MNSFFFHEEIGSAACRGRCGTCKVVLLAGMLGLLSLVTPTARAQGTTNFQPRGVITRIMDLDLWGRDFDPKQFPNLPRDPGEQRPGYRSTPTTQAQLMWKRIMEKAERGEEITGQEGLFIGMMKMNRTWPEGVDIRTPEGRARLQAMKDWMAKDQGIIGNMVATYITRPMVRATGFTDRDLKPTGDWEKFRQYFHSLPPGQRNSMAVLMYNFAKSQGFDMRSDAERAEADRKKAALAAKYDEARKAADEAKRLKDEERRRADEDWRRTVEQTLRSLGYESTPEQAALDKLRAGIPPPRPPAPSTTRRFADMPTNEVQQLLDCLCSQSLGASPQVVQGYNLKIPPDADPKIHSCGSLANGPCMAQGFGCWRSFIEWGNPGISDCLAAFNLPTNNRNVIYEIDKFANAPFEKPLQVTATADRTTICRGEEVTITMSAAGGRPPYYFRSLGDHASCSGPETYGPEDRIKRFGGRELENLDRAVEEDIGKYKSWETIGDAHVGNVWKKDNTFKIKAPHTTGSGYYWDVVVACLTPVAGFGAEGRVKLHDLQ